MAAEKLQSRQNVAIESRRSDGRGHRQQGTASKVAEATGLSKRTVERALKPVDHSPPPPPAADPYEARNRWIIKMNQTWGTAPQEWRDLWLEQIDTPIFDRTRAAA